MRGENPKANTQDREDEERRDNRPSRSCSGGLVRAGRVTSLAGGDESLRSLRISDFVVVKIHQRNDFAVFHFALAEIVQIRLPVAVLNKIFSDTLRQQNVFGIAAIHYPLGDVDAGAGNVRPMVEIGNSA